MCHLYGKVDSYRLAWEAVPDESADPVVGILVTLFMLHGPPLVIKADHGSPFTGKAVRQLLASWGVTLLLSPVRRPQYNGSVEAAHGPLKRNTEQAAARDGRPGQWHSDDLAVARQQANQFRRPRGPNAPTPQQLWRARQPITDRMRRRFLAAADYFRPRDNAPANQQRPTLDPNPVAFAQRRGAVGTGQDRTQEHSITDIEIPASRQGAIQRRALVRALIACRLLHIRRRPLLH